MSRYFASAGIRALQGSSSALSTLRHFPFIVIFGPSGQACQVMPPSGVAGKNPPDPGNLQAYEQSFNHRALAWLKNEIIIGLRRDVPTGANNYTYAWQPYGNTTVKVNGAFTPYTNVSMDNRVMFDGKNWKQIGYSYAADGARSSAGFLRLPGGSVFWFFPQIAAFLTAIYGTYKGDDPVFRVKGVGSGWDPRPGQYGDPGTFDANFRIGNDTAPGGIQGLDGIDYDFHSSISSNVCDIVYHKGSIYLATQYALVGINVGGKGNYIYNDLANDDAVNDITISATYLARAAQGTYGQPTSKCFAQHNDILYMLSAEGKVYQVLPSKIIERADLTTLGTPWASGILSGTNPRQANGSDWSGTNGRRCFITSFNNQLHAFLNFQTNYKVAKGTDGTTAGHGIFWATSYDGTNWTDFSPNLPGSGIISPSGTGVALTNWLTQIAPYRFSGRRSHPGKTDFQAIASGFGKAVEPSGYRQIGPLPYWTSGNMVDPENTAFNALGVPLEYGGISGYIFPTIVAYPKQYHTVSGIFLPQLVGASGYDYTGCHTYHVSGFSDDDTLKVTFSQDFHGGINASDRGQAFYYTLNKASGWTRNNYLSHVNQLNGFIPIDLYDPEILIPSGTIYNPNPRINEVSKRIDVKFRLHDWPYWSRCNVIGEYSIDGTTWAHFGTLKNIQSGPKGTDPSGVIGKEYTATWFYSNDLSINDFYPNVQVRLRAESI